MGSHALPSSIASYTAIHTGMLLPNTRTDETISLEKAKISSFGQLGGFGESTDWSVHRSSKLVA